jgi:hypothetical protein
VQADQSVDLTLSAHKQLQTIGRTTARANTDLVRPGTTQNVYSVNQATQDAVQGLGGGGNLNSAYSALASVPGVSAPIGAGGWGQVVYIHGASYAQVGYEYDGVPVNRAFDNYNADTLSNLGQQELQVITSGSSASSSASTVAGLINQVIRTGTYPGFATVNLGIGGPTQYDSGQVEAGGASQNRSSSYYVGLSQFKQSFRQFDQYNGGTSPGNGFLSTITNNTYTYNAPGVFPNCIVSGGNSTDPFGLTPGDPGYLAPGTGGDPGCANYNLTPSALGGFASSEDHEAVANLHFGIPHKNDALRDDVQLLYSGSYLLGKWYSSLNDYGGVDNVTAINYGVPPVWADGYVVHAPFGTPVVDPLHLRPNLTSSQYYFPSSPIDRSFRSALDPNVRDGSANDSEILKVQYQKNWSHSYLRAFGYSFYSDWLENAPTYGSLASVGGALVGPVSRDYELDTHTRGGELQFADQLSAQHQINATLNYTTASVMRLNNSTFGNGATSSASSLTDGTNCYNASTGNLASCFSSSTAGTFGSLLGATPPAGSPAALANASYILTNPGPTGTWNTVTPKFTTASVTDEWRPNGKTVVNYGLRLERFEYDRPSSTSADYGFWFNQAANTYCYNFVSGQPLFNPVPKGSYLGTPPSLTTGYNNTCGITVAAYNTANGTSLTSPTGRVDSATGQPVGNPNGQFGAVTYTNVGDGNLTRSVLEPRLGATYTLNPDTVLRASAGVYSEPFNTATVQYLNLSAKSAASFDYTNFFGFGFNSPTHNFDPSKSYNLDFSLEKHIRGTDLSFKASPFYRYTKNQYQDFLIGPSFVSSIPTGDETAYGLELQIKKGDPSRNGLSGQLSYTYTNAFFKFHPLANGTTPITPVNQTIDQFNALTSAGNRTGAKGAPCYIGGDPTTAAGFYGGVQVCSPTGGAGNTPSLTGAAGPDVIVNPYFNQAAQPYLSEGAPYQVYQTFPSANGAGGTVDGDQTIVEPHAFSGFLNYRRNRVAYTLAGSATIGSASSNGYARYGSPYTAVGVDPRVCSANQSDVPTATNPGLANYISCDASLAQYGALYIPNPQTGKFDGFGDFRSPWLLNLNAQISYDFSKSVTGRLLLANIYNACFGGSKVPWSAGGSKACGYYPNTYYVSNFYNGSSANDVAANGVTTPAPNQQSYTPTGTGLPFSAYLQLQFKL